MGIKAYARHRDRLGLPGGTPAAVRNAIKTGRLKTALTADRKRVRTAGAADAEWAATTKAEMVPQTGPTAPATAEPPSTEPPPVNELAAARVRKEAASAELAEIELAEKRRELIPARDIENRLADVFLRCRTRLLGIPSRLREQDPTLSAVQLQLVEALIHDALRDLAAGA